MTYARARLWLGICGVGGMVVATTAMLFWQIPYHLFPDSTEWRFADVWALAGFVAGFTLVMLPFDLLGGQVLPRRHGRQSQTLAAFARQWFVGVAIQSTLFFLTGLAILAGGRSAGVPGALAVIALAAGGYFLTQGPLARLLSGGVSLRGSQRINAGSQALDDQGAQQTKCLVVDHTDPGFTGGIVGRPGLETVIIPRRWLEELNESELAVAIARRQQAVASGSRRRGLLVAVTWILLGFLLATLLPGAGVRSIAQLITTCCGFTLWMFVGLLTLPTVSRLASYAIDARVIQRGVSPELLRSTLEKLDRLQDDEPQRPRWIERIFHPVPNLNNRLNGTSSGSPGAWHAARMMLFLSWSCLGLLSRVVHCNVGRPELWVLLPTD